MSRLLENLRVNNFKILHNSCGKSRKSSIKINVCRNKDPVFKLIGLPREARGADFAMQTVARATKAVIEIIIFIVALLAEDLSSP